MDEEIKVAILGQKLEDLKHIVVKIDAAIEKLSEVNTNVIKMLAVHEEKIEYQQKTDDLLVKMIDDNKLENEKDHNKLAERVASLEKEIGEVAKIKWMTVGSGIVLAVLATSMSTLASGWWTPSGMQDAHRIHQQSLTK